MNVKFYKKYQQINIKYNEITYIKNYLNNEECDKILLNFNKKNYYRWKYSNNIDADVDMYGIPYSYVRSNICDINDYKKYKNLYKKNNEEIYKYIEDKIKNIPIKKQIGIQCENNKKLIDVSPFIIRKYTNNRDNEIIHTDCDDNDKAIYSCNIYLNTPIGGELKIYDININPNYLNYTHNKFINNFIKKKLGIPNFIIKPQKGDLIIFNTSYPHYVEKCDNERYSIQTFITIDLNKNLYFGI